MGADDARKLFVGGLSDSITEDTLRDLFEGSGQSVADVHVPRDRESGRPRGFAFVTFDSPDAAELARRAVDGVVHSGRSISVRRFSQEGPRRAPSERPPRAEDRTLFVGKLPYDATTEEVEALFRSHDVAPVERVSLPTGPDGRPRGFGFVTLESAEAANAALEKLAGSQLRGRSLVVTLAQPRGKSGPAGRDGGREGGEAQARVDAGRGSGGRFGAAPSRVPRPSEIRQYPIDSAVPEDDDFEGGVEQVASTSPGEEGPGRRDDKKRKKDKKKRSSERSSRRERGGAGTWHRWESDDD